MDYSTTIVKRNGIYKSFSSTPLEYQTSNKANAIAHFNKKLNELRALNTLLVHFCAFGLANGMDLDLATEILNAVKASELYIMNQGREWWIYAVNNTLSTRQRIRIETKENALFVLKMMDTFIQK